MLSEFEKKVAGFIEANGLLGSADRVLLAVSGGADSIALLYAMSALDADNVLSAELFCAHINHQLRGTEANLDEDFVIAQAAKLKLPVTTKRLDVRGFAGRNKLSIETAARKLRIESLLDMAKGNQCSRIATGHQKNDNAETILHRLARGTGFRGLGGIWPARTFDVPLRLSSQDEAAGDNIKFVRPLLCVTRDEIIEYLKARSLQWRVDHTNVDCTYRRSFIRYRLIPALQQDCTGPIVEQLCELAHSAQKYYILVCTRAEKAWSELADCADDKAVLNLKSFLQESPAVKVELMRRSLASLGSGEKDLTQRHYESILQLAEQNVGGRKIELPGRFVVRREYGNLIFAGPEKSPYSNKQTSSSVKLEIPGQTKFGQYLIQAAILDAGCSSLRSATEDGLMLDARRKIKSRIENRESGLWNGLIWIN